MESLAHLVPQGCLELRVHRDPKEPKVIEDLLDHQVQKEQTETLDALELQGCRASGEKLVAEALGACEGH